MMSSVVVLSTQVQVMKMRSSKIIIKSVAQSIWLYIVLDVNYRTLNILQL